MSRILTISALIFCFFGNIASAAFSEAMSSQNYRITPDSVNAGGEDSSASTSYKLKDTLGEEASGLSNTASYYIKAGYRQASYPCNFNGMCDTGEGETECSNDCGCNSNGICETRRGETAANCFADCNTGGPKEPPGDQTSPVIFNIFAKVEEVYNDSAKIFWETNEQAICRLRLGRTLEYEEKFFEEAMFYYNRTLDIQGLSAGTTYHFKIECRDINYNLSQTGDLSFQTPGIDSEPPANVSNLESEANESEVKIEWDNPSDLDFDEIIIVRNEGFYPKDISDGLIVYRGKDPIFVDKNVEKGKRYYYTIFSRDKAQNYSSGAVISDGAREPGQELPPIPEIPGEIISEIKELTLRDFQFFLNRKEIFLKGDILKAKTGSSLAVFLKYEKAPEVLKTIMVTLKKGEKYFSFLLKATADKKGFLASIASPEESGSYPLEISIFDYKNQKAKKLSGELVIEKEQFPKIYEQPLKDKIAEIFFQKNSLLKLLLLLIFISLISKVAKKKEKEVFKEPPPEDPKMTDEEGRERTDFPNFIN